MKLREVARLLCFSMVGRDRWSTYAGDRDFRYQGVKDCVKDLPNAQWVSLPGLDHLAAMERSDAVLPHVLAFLQNVKIENIA